MPKPVSTEAPTEVVANPEHDGRLRRRFSSGVKRRILSEAGACTEYGTLADTQGFNISYRLVGLHTKRSIDVRTRERIHRRCLRGRSIMRVSTLAAG